MLKYKWAKIFPLITSWNLAMKLTKLIILIILLSGLNVCPVLSQAGDVEIILDRVEHVGTTEFFDTSDLKVKRSGRERKLFGKFVHKMEIDNSITARLTAFMKTTVGWNLLPYKIEKTYCEFFEGDEYFYPELAKFSNAPFPLKCPVPEVSETYTRFKKIYQFDKFCSFQSKLTVGSRHSRMFLTCWRKTANTRSLSRTWKEKTKFLTSMFMCRS